MCRLRGGAEVVVGHSTLYFRQLFSVVEFMPDSVILPELSSITPCGIFFALSSSL
jgi:hypothetical protein